MKTMSHNRMRPFGRRSFRRDPDADALEAEVGRRFDRDADRPTKTGGGRR